MSLVWLVLLALVWLICRSNNLSAVTFNLHGGHQSSVRDTHTVTDYCKYYNKCMTKFHSSHPSQKLHGHTVNDLAAITNADIGSSYYIFCLPAGLNLPVSSSCQLPSFVSMEIFCCRAKGGCELLWHQMYGTIVTSDGAAGIEWTCKRQSNRSRQTRLGKPTEKHVR